MYSRTRGWVGVVVFAVLLGLAAAAGAANALHTAFTRSFSEGCRDVGLGVALLALLLALLWPRRRLTVTLPPRQQVTPPRVPVTDFMPDPPPPPARWQQSLPSATIVDGSIEDLE